LQMANASSAICPGAPGGVGLEGEDADRRVAGVVALQHPGGPVVLVAGDVVPDRDRDRGHGWVSLLRACRRAGPWPGVRVAGRRMDRV